MDNLTILGIFLLSMLLPMTIWSLITKSIPKLKMRHSEPYLDKIVQLKNCLNVQPVDVEDVKYIKRHINNNAAFIGSLIGIDILAILALINISMHEHISFAGILIYIAALGLPSAICLYKGIKNTKAFNNHDSFNKRIGVLLKYKEIVFLGTSKLRSINIYQILIGTYDDNGTPIVFKTKINEFFFRQIQRKNKWFVIMYDGRPACVIEGYNNQTVITDKMVNITDRNVFVTKQRTGRKIAAGLAFLLIITCCINAVINFNVVTIICLPVSMIISYFFCAGVPYINYIVAAFMAIGIIITMPYNITNLQILYLAESVMGVIAICILTANKAVKEHFQKL